MLFSPILGRASGSDSLSLHQKLSRALQFPTISYSDSSLTDWSAYRGFVQFLKDGFPNVHREMELEILGGHALLFKWQGRNAESQPVMFYAHQDVVPVESEDGEGWKFPPFSGEIAEGFVWGRGALDTKSLIICMMEAADRLIAVGFQPSSTIYIALGHDEEVGGNWGAARIARALRERDIRLDWVLDEGLGVIDGAFKDSDPPIALVAMAEKGHANIELRVKGGGGHSAAPPFETVIGTLALALDRLAKNPMEERMLPLVMESLRNAAPLMDKKTQFALKNARLLRKQILAALAKDPLTDAIIRTKISPTIIQGGLKSNVLPKEASVILNVRILPGDSIGSVVEHIRQTIHDDRVEITVMDDPTEPSPVTSHQSQEFAALSETIRDIYPTVIVSPTLMPAGTDSKHFIPLSDNLFRFSPFRIHKDEGSRIHNTNERISLAAVDDMLAFYMLLFQTLPLHGRTSEKNHGAGDRRHDPGAQVPRH
ncbi:MAG: M20/M25/M40 family metallo-hydrolase [Bacteroidia bacterium]